jgi:multicomponent Na+:H+ antiporter subunit G
VISALLWCGVTVAVCASVGMLLLRDPADRLHLTAPLNTAAGLLVPLAVAVQTGWGRAAVKDVFIGLLLLGSGAVVTAATGQAMRSANTPDPYGVNTVGAPTERERQ